MEAWTRTNIHVLVVDDNDDEYVVFIGHDDDDMMKMVIDGKVTVATADD